MADGPAAAGAAAGAAAAAEPRGAGEASASEAKIGEPTGSCVPMFDALWFCYCERCALLRAAAARPPRGRRRSNSPSSDSLPCAAPVHQMKQYYTHGGVDDCTGHWAAFTDCLKRKTTRYAASVPDDPLKGKHPLWTLRTPAEARAAWDAQFRPAEAAAAAAAADGAEDAERGPGMI